MAKRLSTYLITSAIILVLLASCGGGTYVEQSPDIVQIMQVELGSLLDRLAALEDDNRRLKEENRRLQARIASRTPLEAADQVPLPTPELAQPARFYLENDIFAAESRWWNGHPANGSFNMGGSTFHMGVSIENTSTAPASRRFDGTMTGPLYGIATYDISGLGVTVLTGTLGSVGNVTGGTLTVTCADSGRFLGGSDVSGGRNASYHVVTIDIPADVQRVTLLLQTRSWRGPGFGNVYFQ